MVERRPVAQARARQRQGGFTLIELLVGLTLLGLIVAVLAGPMRIGAVGAARIEAQAERLDTVRGVHLFLRSRLEAARPVHWQGRDGAAPLAFTGESDALTFVADMPAYPGTGGLSAMRLALDDGRLVLVRELSDGSGERFAFGRNAARDVLAENVARLEIAYFGRRAGEATARWHATWQDANALPQLVRIAVVPRAGPSWPVLTAALHIGEQPR